MATTGGALPEVVGTDGETGLLVPPDDPGALAAAIGRLLDDEELRRRLGAAGRERVLGRFTWQVTAAGTAERVPGAARGRASGTPRPTGCGRRCRADRRLRDGSGCGPGDRLLDLGCGFGRHAYQAARLGAEVVALDAGADEVRSVRDTFGAMADAGELDAERGPGRRGPGRRALPPLRRPASFDRVIASEVLEHIPDDGARDGRAGPGAAAGRDHGGDRPALWARVRQLGPLRRLPRRARWPRADLPARRAGRPPPRGRSRADRAATTPTVCTLPTGGSGAWSGPTNDTHPAVAAYHRLLVWDIEKAPKVTRYAERVLNPLVGKSLVVYLVKPAPDAEEGVARSFRRAEPALASGAVAVRSIPEVPGVMSAADVIATAQSIASLQRPDGMIPWFPGGHCDPWNHVEAAMALTVAGMDDDADRAYQWLARHAAPRRQLVQLLPDHRSQGPPSRHQRVRLPRDGSLAPLRLDRAISAASRSSGRLSKRASTSSSAGSSPTVRSAGRSIPRDARRSTRSSPAPRRSTTASAARSRVPRRLGHERPDWELAAGRLAHAVAHAPEAFAPKVEFAMDWYYPVLSGAVSGTAARLRILRSWSTFVLDGRGVRCVSTGEWVTAAETAECVLTLDALGLDGAALELLTWVRDLRNRTAPTGPAWSIRRRRPIRRSNGRRTRRAR